MGPTRISPRELAERANFGRFCNVSDPRLAEEPGCIRKAWHKHARGPIMDKLAHRLASQEIPEAISMLSRYGSLATRPGCVLH